MKKRSLALLMLLCVSLCLPVLAQEAAAPVVTSAQLLGTWEAEFPEFGTLRVIFGADGIGATYLEGEFVSSYAFMAQDDLYVVLAEDEEEAGAFELETAVMAFPDADTLRFTSDEGVIEYARAEAAEESAMALDNPFLGKWEADIPSAGAVITFEFFVDGSYSAGMGDQSFGLSAYLVYESMMLTFEGDELCEYTFEVVDADNIDVTEDGQTARFSRVD